MSLTPSFLLLLLLTTLLFSASSAGKCNKDDKRALLAIKAAFPKSQSFAGWTDATACCNWNGITCNDASRVTAFDIAADDTLVGTIPTAIADLPYLDNFLLHNLPNLVGPIPNALAKLKNMQIFDIDMTNVSGTIPPFVFQYPKLVQIDLSFNKLTGTIPTDFTNASPDLSFVRISGNKLTGTLPPQIFHNSIITTDRLTLIFSENRLSGEIPREYGSLDFERVDLSSNNFRGDASFLFGKSKNLDNIDLSRNSFSFDLSSVVFPVNMTYLDLSHNKIYGSIPQQITELSYLVDFDVSYNSLCGEIPSGVQLSTFGASTYVHNKCLCGTPLPACK